MTKVQELGITGVTLVHAGTGAKAVHLDKDDDNCTFSVAFRTFPHDSTGAPHILEHLALCGSNQYPVRDPFFKMLSRSLSTYMNAWTGSDWTMYPFATQNATDYANLRNVYLDAVFAPRLALEDFRQEGWRLEKDEKDGWGLTGVVYNEMKGAFSDGESLFAAQNQQHLLPGSIYAHISGGDPLHIPALSHQNLLHFYRQHYHPANSLLYSYGRLELVPHLEFLDSFLTRNGPYAQPVALQDPLAMLERFSSPRRVELTGSVDPLGDPERQTKLLVSFLTNRTKDAQTTFNLRLMASLLLDGPAAPLHQALIDSNIGREWAPGTGYDASTAAGTFSVGLQGLAEADLERVEQLILETLTKVQRTGFAKERVEAVLHQVELGLRYHAANFGLGLAQRTASAWVHGQCPLEDLSVTKRVLAFQEAYAKGGLFERYIKEYLLDNPHRLTMIMRPDADFMEQSKSKEMALVAKMVSGLSEAEQLAICKQNDQLRVEQDRRDNSKEILPCLSLADTSPTVTPMPYKVHTVAGLTAYTRSSAKANGLGYFTAKLPIKVSGVEEVALLPLLSTCLTELGVLGRPIEEFDQEVRNACSGLDVGILKGRIGRSESGSVQDGSQLPPLSLLLSSHALPENVPRMFALFKEALTQTNWSDHARVRTRLTGAASALSNAIAGSGHSFAVSLAAAALNGRRRCAELMSGLTQAQFLDRLVEADDIAGLAAKLEELGRRLFAHCNNDQASVAWVSDSPRVEEQLQRGSQELLAALGQVSRASAKSTLDLSHYLTKATNDLSLANLAMAMVMPFNTNFVGRAFQGDPYNVTESANLAVLAKLLQPLYLHREIREKGGAYGGGASYSPLDGLFSFYSYRDPSPLRTLEKLDGLANWLEGAVITAQDVLEAQLSIFSELDAPRDVAGEGLYTFSYGITDEDRQAMRDALRKVTPHSVHAIASKYLSSCPMVTFVLVEDRPDMLSGLQSRGFSIRR